MTEDGKLAEALSLQKILHPSKATVCLNQLKNGKVCGPDKIPTTLVKDAANFISYPLTLIYNSSMKNGIFPYYWKITRVALIYKSGKRCDGNNYRPISVLSIFSRVSEKIVQDQLHEFLKMNCILTKNQYAFRTLHSSIISLVNSTEYWRQNIDNQKLNATVFLDLKKAFDTVNHKMLINKLMKYGITGNISGWLRVNKLSANPEKQNSWLLVTNVDYMKSRTSLRSNVMIVK